MTGRWAWPTMGSVASLSIPGTPAGAGDAAMACVRTWFDEVEAALSPFRSDSDLCRWRSGEVDLAACSPLLAEVVTDVAGLPGTTDGGFHPYDRQGRYDPTGYVKGWAIERGMSLLAGRGITDACLGVGGDLQLIGHTRVGRPWRVGIVDPSDDHRLAAMIEAPGDAAWAVATSGTAQRGEHIWSGPGLDRLPGRAVLGSLTVVGPRLSLADAYATAIWARARHVPLEEAWAWLAGSGYEALALDRHGSAWLTPGMRPHLVRPAASMSPLADALDPVAQAVG